MGQTQLRFAQRRIRIRFRYGRSAAARFSGTVFDALLHVFALEFTRQYSFTLDFVLGHYAARSTGTSHMVSPALGGD